MYHHPPTVDVGELQMPEFRVSHAGRIQDHQVQTPFWRPTPKLRDSSSATFGDCSSLERDAMGTDFEGRIEVRMDGV
jgi:hypothetical protein